MCLLLAGSTGKWKRVCVRNLFPAKKLNLGIWDVFSIEQGNAPVYLNWKQTFVRKRGCVFHSTSPGSRKRVCVRNVFSCVSYCTPCPYSWKRVCVKNVFPAKTSTCSIWDVFSIATGNAHVYLSWKQTFVRKRGCVFHSTFPRNRKRVCVRNVFSCVSNFTLFP